MIKVRIGLRFLKLIYSLLKRKASLDRGFYRKIASMCNQITK